MRKITAVLAQLCAVVALAVMSFNASAGLFLKSSGDQWGPAVQDLQLSYNEGVASNNFSRFYATLESRFSLDGSSAADILAAFKAGTDTSSQTVFNGGLSGNTGGNNGSGGTVTGVSQADFTKDQKRQDDQRNADVAAQSQRDAGQDEHINAVQGAAQAANEKADAGAVRMDGIEQQAANLDGRVGNTETRLDTAEGAIRNTQGAAQTANDRATALEGRADNVEAVNGAQDAVLVEHTETLTNHDGRITNAQNTADAAVVIGQNADNKAVNAQNTADVAVKQGQQNSNDIVALYGETSYSASRIDAANANIEANRQALVSTNKKVAENTAQLANHEERIRALEQSSNRNFAALKDKVERNKKDADAGVAGVAAIASIPQVLESQTFAVGAGVGNRHDQQALAVGFSARAAQNVVLKVSAAADTNSGWTVGAGAAIGW